VRGLCGDFPQALVVEDEAALQALPWAAHYGVVSQTTQPIAKVLDLVRKLQQLHPDALVTFKDTVCQPTKDRQVAMDRLCQENDVIIVIGGKNSNNTRQLSETARRAGVGVHQIESAAELQAAWFTPRCRTGVTAGTSTLEETVQAVMARLQQIASASGTSSPHPRPAPSIQRAIA
jgi:4-hydroxy-3-methylbut-2-enyl diphosphate reductase